MRSVIKLVVYLLLVLVFQEVFFRICFPIPELSNFDRAYYAIKNEDEVPGYVRNRKYYWESSIDTPYRFVHKYNGYGFRDKGWTVAKPAGKKRVLFVGDSYVEAVMADSTLPEYFEASAAQENPDVMNAGMLGIGFSRYLRLITDMVPIFKPDHVVLVVYSNDFMDENVEIPTHYKSPVFYPKYRPRVLELWQQYRQGIPVPFGYQPSAKPYFAKAGEADFVWNEQLDRMSDHASSYIVEAMKSGIFNHLRLNEIKREAFYLADHHDYTVPLDYLNYYSSKFDFELAVVYIPSRNQITDHYLKYEFELCKTCDTNMTLTDSLYNQNQINLAKACATSGVPFLDLSDFAREKENNGVRLYWNYDGHFNELGTKLAAKEIYQFVNDNSSLTE